MKNKGLISKFNRPNGFTTIEVLIVIIVLAVVAVVGYVRYGSSDNDDKFARAVAELIISDLAYAQELAITSGKSIVITFTPGTEGTEGTAGNVFQGAGHNPDIRGEGQNGNGRGHGYGWGHLHHNCGGSCGTAGTAPGYSISFADGTPMSYPEAANVPGLRGQVAITNAMSLQFDSSGRLITPGYTWGNTQTEAPAVTLNGRVIVMITRETGKTRVAL